MRNGENVNSLKKTQIKEIQQERDIEAHSYNERKTIYIILKDVRPNDIIEYDYTTEGFNPIFNDKYYYIFSPFLEYTLLQSYYRIVKSVDPLYARYYNGAPAFKVIQNNGNEEWIWESRNNASYKSEEYVPSWYIGSPMVEVSGYSSWKDLEKWGQQIFQDKEPLHPLLLKEIDSIKLKYANNSDRAIAALRFVQKKIRYLGMEVGINSHKPRTANVVFLQRYGDCKDKSLLLSRMLQAMGFEAFPALVNTYLKQDINNRLPSLQLFNHTIVKAYINKRAYWFDPTLQNQGGSIMHNACHNYKYALVLDGVEGLDPVCDIPEAMILVDERITVKDFDGNALLNITTTYFGENADEVRWQLNRKTKKEIQEEFLSFYKNYYDSISFKEDMTVSDDTINNTYTINEYYSIDGFWKADENGFKVSIFSYYVYNKIKFYKTIDANRKSPLALEYPMNIQHNFTIRFPEPMRMKTFLNEIKNDYFSFLTKGECNNNVCTFSYHIKTLGDFVPAAKAGAFIKDIKEICSHYNGMDFSYSNKEVDGYKNKGGIPLFVIFAIMIVLFGASTVWVYKHKRQRG